MYRRSNSELEVFLVHPSGRSGRKKKSRRASASGEEPLDVARREFEEETGFPPQGNFIGLGDWKQPRGKIVTTWAFEGDCDPTKLKSNTFMLESPPRSGRQIEVPEVDRGSWYSIEDARRRLLPGQRAFLDRLVETVR